MGGLAVGRSSGRAVGWRLLGAVVVLTARPADRLSAQVGHDPGHSPYRDIRQGATLRAFGGQFSGTRGRVAVGPSDGPTAGLRLTYGVGGVMGLTAGVAYAQTDAFFFDPNDSVPAPKGPINSDLILADAGLQASLTGGKTWHGFQPYVGATLGFVFGSAFASDTSGYVFGTKFSYGPEAGLRWYPARRFSVEVGWRLVLYRLNYPLSYRPKLLPLTAPLTETTRHPWATFGVGWTF